MPDGGGKSLSQAEVGLVLPIEGDVAGVAQKAEFLGYHYLAAPEHVAFHAPVPNSFLWLSAASGATRSIQLVSTVALPPLYPAVLFAKLVASLDYLSAGRFAVGVGVGGEYEEEFRAVGIPLAERAPRTDEALDVLRTLLEASEPRSYAGKFTTFDNLLLAPKRGLGCPPIWVGGRRQPAMRRAARYGDVWMPYMFSPEQTAKGRASVQDYAREYDRRDGSVATGIYLFAVMADHEARGREQAVQFASLRYQQDFRPLAHKFLVGSPDAMLTRMQEYAAAGVTRFILELACHPADYEEQMERLAYEILPRCPEGGKA
jgi:alkanesulfonate monooxygenase SsuD/methylene tetrahydromethanopterin reductase-like flavin-dependent oxidoreductase (luciferase family)